MKHLTCADSITYFYLVASVASSASVRIDIPSCSFVPNSPEQLAAAVKKGLDKGRARKRVKDTVREE